MDSRGEVEKFIDELDDNTDEIELGIREIYSSVNTSHQRGPRGPVTFDKSDETDEVIRATRRQYERWVTAAHQIILEYVSSRNDEFVDLYGEIIEEISLEQDAPINMDKAIETLIHKFHRQIDILHTVPPKLEAKRLTTRRRISKSVSKDEITRARNLFDEGLLRASGVVAGVALERHLLTMCEESNSISDFNHDDGIGSLAQKLYDADKIDKTTLSSLKTLSSIRADCAHANQKEPNEHKVHRLIDDTDDYIRGRGI